MCSCVKCSGCDGEGDVWFSFSGEFLGSHHWDDLDSLEPCPFCGGSGYEYECPECCDEYEEY